jgi:hypothetical protein
MPSGMLLLRLVPVRSHAGRRAQKLLGAFGDGPRGTAALFAAIARPGGRSGPQLTTSAAIERSADR